MIRISLISFLLTTAAAVATPAGSPVLDMPVVVIPERDEALLSLLPEGTANAGKLSRESSVALMDTIRKEMSERYSAESEVDEGRIAELLSGDYLDEVLPGPASPVNFLNSPFEPAAAHDAGLAPLTETPAVPGFADLAMTPEGLRALAAMTPDQIKAVAAMAELSRNPNAEVSALLASAQPEAAQRPVLNVGNGQNIGLVDWYAALDTSGQVYIANDTLAGSEIGIAEGLVVGQFGPVTGVEVDGDTVAVTFASGDVIASRSQDDAYEIGPAIPALGAIGEEPVDAASAFAELLEPMPFEEEILLSEGAPRRDGVTRPLPRPASIAERSSAGTVLAGTPGKS